MREELSQRLALDKWLGLGLVSKIQNLRICLGFRNQDLDSAEP